MVTKNTYRILIWIIVILLATNLSTVFSFIYHRIREEKLIKQPEKESVEVPAERRTKFFREQLNLDPSQIDAFRQINREFNHTAWQINHQLNILRIDMVRELGRENPDEKKLTDISDNIGKLHTELKNITIHYYLALKKCCNKMQQEKLNEIFMSLLQNSEDVKLPRGRRHRNNR